MRLIGAFNDKKLAKHFCDFLNSQGMDSQLRQHDTEFEVWVLDNDFLDRAKAHYINFNRDPNDSRFHVNYKDRVRQQRVKDRELKRHYRQYFAKAHGNQITISLIVICIVIYLVTLTSLRNSVFASLIISVPGYAPSSVWIVQPWRLLTPMFLHFSVWHILFNLFWLYDLGSLIETKDGKIFYIILILIASLGSSLLQFIMAGPFFGGMSGVVYALFSYIWISSKYNLRSGYYMSNTIVIWMVAWFALCFTGLLGPVANYGHLGGLIVGVLFAYGRKWMQERG